jgi:hypothetical protein
LFRANMKDFQYHVSAKLQHSSKSTVAFAPVAASNMALISVVT